MGDAEEDVLIAIHAIRQRVPQGQTTMIKMDAIQKEVRAIIGRDLTRAVVVQAVQFLHGLGFTSTPQLDAVGQPQFINSLTAEGEEAAERIKRQRGLG